MKEGALVANYGGRTDNYPGSMINHEASADGCCRMDVGTKPLIYQGLNGECQLLSAVAPEDVSEAMSLYDLVALEVHKGREHVLDRRVALRDGCQIG